LASQLSNQGGSVNNLSALASQQQHSQQQQPQSSYLSVSLEPAGRKAANASPRERQYGDDYKSHARASASHRAQGSSSIITAAPSTTQFNTLSASSGGLSGIEFQGSPSVGAIEPSTVSQPSVDEPVQSH
jgi:hypothetical protein